MACSPVGLTRSWKVGFDSGQAWIYSGSFSTARVFYATAWIISTLNSYLYPQFKIWVISFTSIHNFCCLFFKVLNKKRPQLFYPSFKWENAVLVYVVFGINPWRARLHGDGGPQVGEVTCDYSPHLSCKRDQIKMRNFMDRRITPSIAGYLTYLGSPTFM